MTADLENLKTQMQSLAQTAARSVAEVQTIEQLEQIRVEYLGKKGVLSQMLGAMGKLPAEDRPQVGAIANEIKQTLQAQLDERRNALQQADIANKLDSETLDVTMPGVMRPQGRIHPLQGTVDRMLDILVGLGFTMAQGPEIETDYYNFEALNTPADHPARDMQDTLYLTDGKLLRTQTSSVQIRYMEANEPPFRIVCPGGRVYRKDDVDATHSPIFHQIELLAVDEELTFGDLKGTVKTFVEELLGDRPIRFRPSYFPFTEPSAEVDVFWNGRWLELGGCGMVDPNVFKAVGYDSEAVTGFAWGFGVDRVAMVLHQIDDIRRLFNSDLRFLKQF